MPFRRWEEPEGGTGSESFGIDNWPATNARRSASAARQLTSTDQLGSARRMSATAVTLRNGGQAAREPRGRPTTAGQPAPYARPSAQRRGRRKLIEIRRLR